VNAATNRTGEYLALHRAIEEDCEMPSGREVSLSVLWDDVQCARDALIRAREELRRATQHVMTATDAWMTAAAGDPTPTLSQRGPLKAV